MNKKIPIIVLFVVLFGLGMSNAKELKIGSLAPTFQARDDRGKDFQSQQLLGKKNLVIYFYPAAMTGGCTAQACGFRDAQSKFARLNAVVVGVSGDSVQNLAWFKQVNNLNFLLLADPDGSIAKAFGVPTRDGGEITRTVNDNEVKLVRGVTESRWTFVIDTEGKIVYKDTDVNAGQDSHKVLEFLKLRQGSNEK